MSGVYAISGEKVFLCFMGLYKIVGNFLIYVNDVEITSH